VITDIHSHILPDVDDGPATIEESVALARAFVADGVERVVATPHVSLRMPTPPALIQERVAALRDALVAERIPLVVLAGAEVSAPHLPSLDATALRSLTLGGGGWILLEPPMNSDFPIEAAAQELLDAGYGVVLAHPERCRLFHRDPVGRLRPMVEAGVRVSITSSALRGAFGKLPGKIARELIKAKLVHNAVGDAHGLDARRPTLLSDLRGAKLADRVPAWCEALPASVLGDPGAGAA
jgi:protein-tyrosine phosphatase